MIIIRIHVIHVICVIHVIHVMVFFFVPGCPAATVLRAVGVQVEI